MAFVKPFIMDGKEYNVHVMKMIRKFAVTDSELTGRVQTGEMYRDIIGTFYNYTMTIAPKNGDIGAMDDLWDEISKPQEYHICEFPYNQSTLAQRMYVTSGEQPLIQINENENVWGDITINYIAMEPEVVP